MGLFDRFKKKEEREGAVLPSFVLLSDVSLDLDQLARDFYADWGIELPILDDEDAEDDDFPTLVTEIDNMNVAISLMPAPVPNGEAVECAKTNFRWSDAVSAAERHEAHALIIVMPLTKRPLAEVATLHAKLCASCLKQPNALGIHTAGTVFDPAFYMGSAKFAVENKTFPIMNHVFFGLYSNDEGKTFSGYTFGLLTLGKQELEILDSTAGPDEVVGFLIDIASYIMNADVTLKHGETIGFTADQKLTIAESQGVALDGKTLKIGF